MATSNPGLSIHIQKDNRSAGAVYRQIAGEIVRRIEDGALPRGSRLPTVRELSESLSITRVTAHKAYAELQASGWIESTVGRGTFVAAAAHRAAAVLADPTLRAVTVDGVMGAMHRFREIPDMASLAVAEPDPGLYPARAFLQLFQGLTDDAARLFEYGSPRGELDLRIELATLLAERGIAAGPEDILVTSGATQALTLVTAALCQPGDRVAVEQPTYLGVLGLLKSYGVEPVGVPLDDEGPRLDRLQRIFVRERPAFFYTIPTFQNPTGRTMSPERRSKLLWLAADHGVTIVEDDIYRPLAYSEPPPPPSPIKAQDCEHGVVYVDGFSKVLLPGVRVGYVVAPPRLRDRLVRLQQVREICGPPILQRTLGEFLRRGLFKKHLERVVPIYAARRDAMLETLAEAMPDDVEWTMPDGGYCVWVTLPDHRGLEDLYEAALERGVAFTPGEVFQAQPEPGRCLRLCFGTLTEDRIRQAVSTLGQLIAERLRTSPSGRHRPAELKPVV